MTSERPVRGDERDPTALPRPSGPGPILVLAPGLTANAHSFDGLMRAGLGDVARVIALDLRGRGESDAPASGYTMEDHARDVLGLLDALELERVVMGGHSFGGLLTYWLAANHPERVERCVVLDAPAVVDPGVVEQIRPSLARLGRVYPSWDEYVALVRSMPYFDEGGWDSDVESYFRADVRTAARRDGAGALPARAHRRRRSRARSRSTGRRSSPASPSRRCSCAHPVASVLPARPRSSPARTRTGRRR